MIRANFWYRLRTRVNRFFRAVNRVLFAPIARMMKRFERSADRSLFSLGNLLKKPLLIIGKILMWPINTSYRLGRPVFQAMGRVLSPLLVYLKPFQRMWYAFVRFLTARFATLGGFLSAYWKTRPWKRLLYGLPAIVLLMPFLISLALIPVYSNASKAKRYRVAALKAYEDQRFDEADLYHRKLVQLGVEDQIVELQSILAVSEGEDPNEAFPRMQNLAPLDGRGVASAHAWIVRALSRGDIDMPEEERFELERKHIDKLLEMAGNNVTVRIFDAHWLLRRGDWKAASRKFREIVPKNMDEQLQLARFARAVFGQDAAVELVRNADEAYSLAVQDGRTLSVDQYRNLLLARYMLNGYEAIDQLINDALEAHGDDVDLRDYCVQLVREEAQRTRPGDPRRIELVKRMLGFGRDLEQAQSATVGLLLGSETEKNFAESTLDAMFTSGTLQLQSGIDWTSFLYASQEAEKCLAVLEYLGARFVESAEVSNNLAFLLSVRDQIDPSQSPDLERALELANRAVSLSEGDGEAHAGYLDTRAAIFAKLEQWDNARRDYEAALQGMPDNPQVHAALAYVLESQEIPDVERARMHRETAAYLQFR